MQTLVIYLFGDVAFAVVVVVVAVVAVVVVVATAAAAGAVSGLMTTSFCSFSSAFWRSRAMVLSSTQL